MTVVYPLTAAERHTIREGLFETMPDFERPWRMLLHLWMQYWGEHPRTISIGCRTMRRPSAICS